MPVLRILNVWNTPAPEGLRNYGSGLALHSRRSAKRVAQGLHVLAIHSLPECSAHRLRGDADRCLRGALGTPRHSVPSGSRGRLPRGYPNCSGKQSPPRPRRRPGGRTPGSWLWSSTRQHKPFHTRRPTQPSCRHIDRRQSGGGMSLRGTVNCLQVHQVRFTGAARLRPVGTEQWSRMALWRGRTCRCPAAPALSVAHRVEEEHRHDLGRAAPRRGVALMEWMRRWLAKSCRTSTVVASSGGGGGGVCHVGVFPGFWGAKGAVLGRFRHVTARPGPASGGNERGIAVTWPLPRLRQVTSLAGPASLRKLLAKPPWVLALLRLLPVSGFLLLCHCHVQHYEK